MIDLQTITPAEQTTSVDIPPFENMVWVPGGTFLMGSDAHYPEEAPTHNVSVDGFWMDTHLVTNSQFSRFVAATGHVTVAERAPKAEDYPGALPEMLVPGSVVFGRPSQPVDMNNHYNWWHWIPGADWRHPLGPKSSLTGREQYPAVHLAWEDVVAYAEWIGKELPTEAEWEFAARGGLEGQEFAWGDKFAPDGKQMANTWQGKFPYQNLLKDGYEGISPVGVFPANGYGLYDMIGNVWEWTTDWYEATHPMTHACCTLSNPRGGEREKSYDPQMTEILIPRRVLKGGSHLCAPNYCRRYRPAARMPQQIDTSTNHIGFRCIVRPSII